MTFFESQFKSRLEGIFSTQKTSRPTLAPTQPPHKWVPGFFPWVKQPKHDAVHSHPSHAEVKTLLCPYSPFVSSCNVWNDFTCMEPTDSLLGSQEPATCLYPEPYESSVPCYTSSLRSVLLIFSHLCLGPVNDLFPSGFPPKFCMHSSFPPSGIPTGGGLNAPPPSKNSEGPPKSCRTQPDCENC